MQKIYKNLTYKYFLYRFKLYICLSNNAKRKKDKMKNLVKSVNGKEVARKEYLTFEAATNAGNSWTKDCTVDHNIRKERSFIVE